MTTENQNIQKLKESVLEKEKEIINLSKHPGLYANEIKSKRLSIKMYKRLIGIAERRQNAQS